VPSTFVISITPFSEDGAFDEDAIRGHLQRMAAAGIGVYLGGGGSGEGYVLSSDEADRLLRIGVEELSGKVPIRAMGVEPRTSGDMIEFMEMAAGAGVDAAQIYSLDQGHGHRPNTDEIYRYFDDVLRASDFPAVLSTHQSVGYQVPVAMLVEFADRFDHLIGINISHQDLGYLTAIVDALGERLEIHVGGPHLALTALSLGATGFLSSEGNLAPHLCVGVIDAYDANDARSMADLFGTLLRLSASFYGAGGIRATKAVLNALGLPGGFPRPPQLPASEATVSTLLDVVGRLGIGKIEGWEFIQR
jgi:4-hydroxy-tetrahydrodipicolinate synthase